jgi:hypothetical protein
MIWKKESRAGAIREHPKSKHFCRFWQERKRRRNWRREIAWFMLAPRSRQVVFLWKENYSRPENWKQTLISIRERTLRGGWV